MARRRRSRGAIPQELRLAYGARARTLGLAVLSLLPPPGSPCPVCSRRRRAPAGCLACRGWAHLLRDGDPVAYRRLVTRAVCAFDAAAPPPPRYTLGNAGHSQAKLVSEMIKSIVTDPSCTNNNVLYTGSRQGGQNRCVADLVSSSSWEILLHRIGDLHMCYILKHSSIFLPIKKNDYFQVNGLPLNVVLQKPIFATAMARNQQTQSKKEKCSMCYVCRHTEIAQNISGDNCVSSSNIGFYSPGAGTWKFDGLLSARITEHNSSTEGCNCFKFPSASRSTNCSCLYTQNPRKRKRKRLYSWQRLNKQKQICSEDRSSTEWSNIDGDFNVQNLLVEDSNFKVNDEVHSLESTSDNNSVAMNRDANYSQTKQRHGVTVLSSSSFQPTCPQVGLPSSLHLNNCPPCFNCVILNSSKCVSVDSLISRHVIFYNRRTSYNVFHGNHILNKKEMPYALSLIKHIFGIKACCAKFLKCNHDESTTTNSNCSCFWMLKLLKNLIRNSKRCQYKKLFLKHCSVKSKVATNVAMNEKKPQSFVQLEAHSTHQEVVSFVWAVLTRIVPEPLLGSSYSKRSLRLNIWKFIQLRRFETFHITDCIGELKVSHYSWISNIGLSDCFCSALMAKKMGLSNDSDEQKHKNLLQCWIQWLFSDIVIPLIQAYFYVTERESRRYDVFYYPKTVWRDITSNAIASLNGQSFKILRGTSRREVKHSYSSSRVRFVPKAKDVRPLVNLKAQSKDGLLNKCNLIIRKVKDENPEMFGSSVFDYNNVHQNLSRFISSVRSHLKEKQKVFIIVADVSKAYDCISHDMLLKILDNVLRCDDYVLRKCTRVVCNRSNNATYRFDSNVCISEGNGICDFSIQLSSTGGILVDQGKTSRVQKKELQRLLSQQVKRNILEIGKKNYLQQVGIPQGSKLSPNLCSLYYGHLENSVLLKFLSDGEINSGEDVSVPKSLLMRLIDDFIFISFSKENALNFLNRTRRGFVYYNCYMNDSKYGFNFEVADSEHCCNRLYRGDDGFSFIPWSGLLINCETLEVQADYTRYLDITISSTITVKIHSSTRDLQNKLCHYMRPKCHPIFYDSMINSPSTVRLNIYQAFLLCAMKFHCYVRTMHDAMSKSELLHIIKRSFGYMHSRIIKRTQEVELQYNVHPVLKLKRKETMWLGLYAYLRVLQRKQSRYKDLLALLTAEIDRYDHMDRCSDSLRYAVDDSHSSMFWKFKF